MKLSSYPHILSLGHKALKELLDGPVVVEEKIDGSQVSFSVDEETGELRMRSRGAEIVVGAPDPMFTRGVEAVKEIAKGLMPGWIYRGEYLQKPKHNVLAYNRIPAKHVMIFDINVGLEDYLPYEGKAREAERLGLEVVPKLFEGIVTLEVLKELLGRESILGGPKIEGVVIKPVGYGLLGTDGKALLGKFVSEAFKESHRREWKGLNPGGKDIIGMLIERYRTTPRWEKAIQHLREEGRLQDAPQDIGPLLKEVVTDLKREEEAEIKEMLFAWAWKGIARGAVAGLPEWYKERLLGSQFE